VLSPSAPAGDATRAINVRTEGGASPVVRPPSTGSGSGRP